MIKKLFCLIWGHKSISKAFTGETVSVGGVMGNPYTLILYKLERNKFCPRCGKHIQED